MCFLPSLELCLHAGVVQLLSLVSRARSAFHAVLAVRSVSVENRGVPMFALFVVLRMFFRQCGVSRTDIIVPLLKIILS